MTQWEYKILSAASLPEMTQVVEHTLNNGGGWRLTGSLTVVLIPGLHMTLTFYREVVREVFVGDISLDAKK